MPRCAPPPHAMDVGRSPQRLGWCDASPRRVAGESQQLAYGCIHRILQQLPGSPQSANNRKSFIPSGADIGADHRYQPEPVVAWLCCASAVLGFRKKIAPFRPTRHASTHLNPKEAIETSRPSPSCRKRTQHWPVRNSRPDSIQALQLFLLLNFLLS